MSEPLGLLILTLDDLSLDDESHDFHMLNMYSGTRFTIQNRISIFLTRIILTSLQQMSVFCYAKRQAHERKSTCFSLVWWTSELRLTRILRYEIMVLRNYAEDVILQASTQNTCKTFCGT